MRRSRSWAALTGLLLQGLWALGAGPASAQGADQGYRANPAYAGALGGGVEPVDVRQSRSSVTLGGTVVPHKEVTLAAQLPGRVKYLAGTEGDQFREGQLLAELDDKDLRAQQQAAWAALRDADAAMRNAGMQYSRELVAPGQSSPSSMPGMGMPSLFDQFFTRPMGNMMGYGDPRLEREANLYSRGTQMEQARNSYVKAQSQLQQLEAKFRDAKSIAPFTGVIVKKFIEIGDTVQPGQPLLKFADTQYLQIQVDVPARLMPGIREGMELDAKLDVRNAHVKVRVAQVFPMADPQRHTVTVKLDVQLGSSAAPGMYAEVMIPDVDAPPRQVLVIPASAIVQRGSLPMVYVAKGPQEKELRIVRLGEYLDASHVTVLSGLKPGEYVHVGPRQDADTPGGGRYPPAPTRLRR